MLDIRHYSEQLNFNEDVLSRALTGLDLAAQKHEALPQITIRILDDIKESEPYIFNCSSALYKQFCHSCCHALSEYLIYALHGQQGFSVAHIQIIQGYTVHSCIEITRNGLVFFLDAGGVFNSLDQILQRYQTDSSILPPFEIVRRTGASVVDDCDNNEVRKLMELTPFWEVLAVIAESEGLESAGDFEEAALSNIAFAIIR